MAGSWIASHIAGKYTYDFSGDYAKITHNSSLDITGSFRLGFQVKLDQLFLTSTLWSKGTGSLADPTVTSLNIQSVGGYLRAMISDGTKFLVYDTNVPIFSTYKAVQVDIVWDNTLKLMKIYKDGVNLPITINISSGTYYSSPASFTTLLITTLADLNFGQGTDQNSFKGKLFGAIYASRAYTSSEIFDYFNGKEDTVSTPPTDVILYTAKSLLANPYNIYEMYGNGSNKNLKISSTHVLYTPIYNASKTKISYWDVNTAFCHTKDLITSIDLANSPSYFNSQICPTDATKMVVAYANRLGDGKQRLTLCNPNVANSTLADTAHNLTGIFTMEGGSKYGYNGIDTYIYGLLFNGSGDSAIARWDSDLNDASKIIIYTQNGIGGHYAMFDEFSVSPDGTKIAFSAQVTSTLYQIFTINVNGTGLTQITAEAQSCTNPVWSPDGTKIAFSIANGVSFGSYLGGQIHIMNADGSNIINISNNSNDEIVNDWK